MMAATTDDRSAAEPCAEDPAQVLLTWQSHPVQRDGSRRWIAVAVLLAIPAVLLFLYGAFYALMAIVILGGSLMSFFLPTKYVLYTGGLESHFLGMTRRFTWSQFRSYYPDKHGVLLSPFVVPSRLENFRGFYLRFDGREGDVMRIVTDRIPTPADRESTS